jgi:hypothetical protein
VTDFTAARQQLTRLVHSQSLISQAQRGIVPDFRPDAPDEYLALCRAGGQMAFTRKLPIWDGASDSTIYLSAEANRQFRFWHDMGHLETGLSFSAADEEALQRAHHIPRLEKFGLERGSLAWKLYEADTVGQIEYYLQFRDFPTDQLAFSTTYALSPADALARTW